MVDVASVRPFFGIKERVRAPQQPIRPPRDPLTPLTPFVQVPELDAMDGALCSVHAGIPSYDFMIVLLGLPVIPEHLHFYSHLLVSCLINNLN
jgi:hypothetical protein